MLPLKMKCQETGFTIATERTKTKPDKIYQTILVVVVVFSPK